MQRSTVTFCGLHDESFEMLNVVILNGGRGAAATIAALNARQGLHVTSVVNAYDDGKSTGAIRRFFGMLGPSDIRKVQELMLPQDDPDYAANLNVFRFRFPEGVAHMDAIAHLKSFASGQSEELTGSRFESEKVRTSLRAFVREFLASLHAIEAVRGENFDFSDCSVMNCIYAGAFLRFNRNFEEAIRFMDRLFKLRGTVLPTSIEDKQLVGLRENGQMLYSEAEIVELRSNVRIDRIYLLDKPIERASFEPLTAEQKRFFLERHHCYVGLSPGVRYALQQADIIIYSAGTQHSSLYPTYLSAGLAESIADNKTALKAFVTNIGADYETPTYKASDYIKGAHRYLNLSAARTYAMQELFNVVLLNRSRRKTDETYVDFDEDGFSDVPVRRVIDDFESPAAPGKHDGVKVVQTVIDLYEASTVLL
jgi:2-phospho-L-lactate transferase/gluconeogenesis factor (CofD/UPF0052 family)